MAFKRKSVLKATEWDQHINEYLTIRKSENSAERPDQLQAAYWSMAVAGVLGAMYIYKKMKKS